MFIHGYPRTGPRRMMEKVQDNNCFTLKNIVKHWTEIELLRGRLTETQ
jgi:hypothetical protein